MKYFIQYLGFSRGFSTDDEYSVSIITDSRQGPFRIDQRVSFSCVVEPTPPDNVTYQWRTVDYPYGGSTYTQQNFSRSYYYSNLRYCWYFCDVLLNGTVLGSANRIVEVQGKFLSRMREL